MNYVQLKDPSSSDVDFSLDWTSYLEAGEEVNASTWAPSDPAGLTIVTSAYSATLTTVYVSGGVRGQVYRLRNTIGTTNGRSDDRSLTIRIGAL